MPSAGLRTPAALTLALVLCAAGGCGASRGAPASVSRSAAAPAGHGRVSVLYAGSLVHLMETSVGPAFDGATGYTFQGYAGGSQALASQIQGGLRRADVFISAAPSVDAALGPKGGDWVQWYASFATAPLVIGYNPSSRFATALTTQPWYQVLVEPGFRLGRTDPKLDPKGALTVKFVQAAAAYYHRPTLERQILGTPENAAQVFPEASLVGRLQAGQLDAGFFYSNEAKDAGIPTLTLPTPLAVGAVFTVTVVRNAPDPAGAVAFVRFLLGSHGAALLRADGLTVLPPKVSGEHSAVPAGLAASLGG